jgi:uncharacterized membrane protein YfcA
MDFVLVALTAFIISALTFISGFGLGTLLMPVFALFFPLEIAVAATAIVHLANNIYKVALVGKYADKKVTLQFALPAAAAAFAGAWLLSALISVKPIITLSIFNTTFSILPVKVLIALVMIFFALFEMVPSLRNFKFGSKSLSLGGILSGFFGGLSGHQGALRTAFLLRAGLDKNGFIGTMVLSSVVIDVVRIIVYGSDFLIEDLQILAGTNILTMLIVGSLASFAGSYLGKHLFEKTAYKTLQILIAALLILFALALGLGIV